MAKTDFQSPSEFTQEAIRLARESSRNDSLGERVTDCTPTETKHVVHLMLTESDIEQLYRLMNLGVPNRARPSPGANDSQPRTSSPQ